MNETSERIGPYVGQLAAQFTFPAFVAALRDLPLQVVAPENRVLNELRNRTVCVPMPGPDGGTLTVVVKAFARPSRMRSRIYRRQGSKANRSWQMATYLAERGLGTPSPLGFLERWERGELVESYFLTEFQPSAVEARAELIRLFDGEPPYEDGKRLLILIAREVRALHAAGIQHNDLGHQNILVDPTPTGWENAQFIDLNRARRRSALSTRQRALEVARLWLPHSLQPMFLSAYFEQMNVPPGFHVWLGIYRIISSIRSHTHDLRHPLRARRWKLRNLPRLKYPLAATR